MSCTSAHDSSVGGTRCCGVPAPVCPCIVRVPQCCACCASLFFLWVSLTHDRYRLAVQEKRPIPLAKCGRREGLEFAFTIALAASILLWSFWVINFAMALLG